MSIIKNFAAFALFSANRLAAATLCSRELQSPAEVTSMPTFEDGISSYLSRNLSEDVWNQLSEKEDAFGFTFKQAIFSGCQNPDSGVGVYAGSPDSYDAFAPLFDPIINQYHKREPDQVHVSDMDYRKLESKIEPFAPEDAKLIQSTRIRVARNLAGQPLGPGMSREQRLEIESKVIEACNKFTGDLAGTYYSLSTLSDADRKSLIEDHFLFKEGDRFLEAAGLNRDWPEGRGIFHNNEKTFLVWINEEDQLRIISMQQGSDFGAVFSRLARASEEIEKVVKFAHNERLGYLTSCPTNIGTGMRASVHVSLPNLGEKMEMFKKIADAHNVQIRGIHGEHSESSDHIYDISNKQRLGRSEVQLVQDMHNGVKVLLQTESQLAAIYREREEL